MAELVSSNNVARGDTENKNRIEYVIIIDQSVIRGNFQRDARYVISVRAIVMSVHPTIYHNTMII